MRGQFHTISIFTDFYLKNSILGTNQKLSEDFRYSHGKRSVHFESFQLKPRFLIMARYQR